MMKAIVQAGGPGAEDSMALSDTVPMPEGLGADQIMIRVHTAGLNRMDLLQVGGL